MATLSVTHPTLMDWTKLLDPQGKIDGIVELIQPVLEELEDMVWQEGNLPTGHRSTQRTSYSTPTWRKLNGVVQPTKTTTAQITDSCGMLEDYSEVDKKLADLNGNTAAFMLSQSIGKLHGMAKEMADTLWYGDENTAPEEFTGFYPRFNSKTGVTAENLIDGGGASGQTDCTSIWLIVWAPHTIHGIFPKGSRAGWQETYKGQVTAENVGGQIGRMEVYRTHYLWEAGITLPDWRYAVRIHSVDTSTLTKNAASGTDLIDCITQAMELVPSLGTGRAAIYCNRKIRSFLRRQIANKIANSTLTMETVAGRHVMMMDGVPVRRTDSILNTEASLN